MRAGLGVDQLRIDPQPTGVALHRAFELVANAKLPADLFGVYISALVGEGSVARDDETVGHARNLGGEVLGDAVDEIILGRIAGETGEGQHDDREVRRVR
jgi:hypothetical protein